MKLRGFFLLIIALCSVFVIIAKSAPLMLIISLAIFVISFFSITLSAQAWIIAGSLTTITNFFLPNITVFYHVSFFLASLIYFVFNFRRLKNNNYFLTLIIISFFVVFSTYNYSESVNINKMLIVPITLFISYFISILIINDKLKFNDISLSLLFFGLSACFVLAQNPIESGRLGIEGNVRVVSNALGFPILFLFLNIYNSKTTLIIKSIYISAIIIMSVLFILSISRGAIIALILAIIVGLYIYNKNNFKMINILKSFLVLILLGASIFLFGANYFAANKALFDKRFGQDALDSGVDIRGYIWERVLSSMNFWEFVFGMGVDGFVQRSNSIALFYYSHSVFIDIIVSSGIISFSIFAFFILKKLFWSIKAMNYLSSALFIFAIFNFASHGSITSSLFWAIIGIAVGFYYRRDYVKVV